MRFTLLFFAILANFALGSCGASVDDDVTRIAFIGSENELATSGLKLSPAAQHLRAATSEGLVTLNAQGEVVPALAERWIITDDGKSYIFRLRNSSWSDGTALSGENVRAALGRNLQELKGTSLGLDLSIIDDTRAMTGRVIEIRLKSPMPQFLQLLAQPELGLRHKGKGAGPMLAEVTENAAMLEVASPEMRGVAFEERWRDQTRRIEIFSLSAEDSAVAFEKGDVDAVFNGHLLSIPLADTGPLSRGTVRLDLVYGLFGIKIQNSDGLLSDLTRREALAMAIEREDLLEPFGIGGWVPSTLIVPQGLAEALPDRQERWVGQSLAARKAEAKRRITAWRGRSGGKSARLTIALPKRIGTGRFFNELSKDFAEIGVDLVQASPNDSADLELVDRLARFGDPRWFLNQFNCGLNDGLCASDADELVQSALVESNPQAKAQLYAEAERALQQSNIYLPLGAPVRWSLIRSGIDGFNENPWGLHPLFPMALRPN